MKKILFIIASLLIISHYTLANIGCRIDLNFKGLEEKKILFGYQYGNKQIIIDSITLDKYGKGFYQNKNRLHGGIYVVIFPNNQYLEVLINNEQFFSIISDTSDILNKLTIEGADESDLFRQYQLLVTKTPSDKANRKRESGLDTIAYKSRKELNIFKHKVYNEYPSSFLAKYLRMLENIDIPENMRYQQPEPSRKTFYERHNYVKTHYFDNIDWADTRLLRSYAIYDKIDYYFKKMISRNADSIIQSISQVVTKSKVNEESYKFVLSYLISNFKEPDNPEKEKIFIYLAENYYLNGKASWADKNFIKLIQKRYDTIKKYSIGSEASELNLVTDKGKDVQLTKIESKWLILYFWSPDCPVCNNQTPKLKELYKKYHSSGLEVLAIYTHADKQQWLTYIKENDLEWINAYDPALKSDFMRLYNIKSTPAIYLLDKDKKIVSRSINIRSIEEKMKQGDTN